MRRSQPYLAVHVSSSGRNSCLRRGRACSQPFELPIHHRPARPLTTSLRKSMMAWRMRRALVAAAAMNCSSGVALCAHAPSSRQRAASRVQAAPQYDSGNAAFQDGGFARQPPASTACVPASPAPAHPPQCRLASAPARRCQSSAAAGFAPSATGRAAGLQGEADPASAAAGYSTAHSDY